MNIRYIDAEGLAYRVDERVPGGPVEVTGAACPACGEPLVVKRFAETRACCCACGSPAGELAKRSPMPLSEAWTEARRRWGATAIVERREDPDECVVGTVTTASVEYGRGATFEQAFVNADEHGVRR